ncbi:MAG: ABC transporter permease [Longimicrobiales bacterium]
MNEPKSAPGLDASARVYGVLLHLYSKGFRAAHAQDAVDLFRDRFNEEFQRRGWFGILLFWLKTLVNVGWHGIADRLGAAFTRRGDRSDSAFGRDLAYAVRSLRRAPGFAVGAAITLALGIGATVTLYTLVDSVLLRPLPYPESDRIVQLWEANPSIGLDKEGPSPWNFVDWERSTTSFESMTAWYLTSGTYRDENRAEEVRSAQVTTGFFRVLGVTPELGRDFQELEGVPYGPVMLSDRFGVEFTERIPRWWGVRWS